MKKNAYAAAIALALTTLAAGQVLAADNSVQGKTRDQVRAELAEAQRTGDIVVSANAGDELGVGRKLNEVAPASYTAAKADPQGKTRAQVKAELAQAQRNGDIVVGNSGDELGVGRKLNQVFPSRYSAKAVN